ncbi:hypothetical protein ACFYRC_34200 [Streptomyces sp. NPDC005279]|uniref:DNA polymerase III subunit beta family protein n=1 Tax=Streptomyces sp. NPDC005279 TaxID=3364712 RepID=UPI00368BF72A
MNDADRYRFALRRIDRKASSGTTDGRALVPAKALLGTAKMLVDAEQVDLTLPSDQGVLGMAGPARSTTMRALEGQLPNYKALWHTGRLHRQRRRRQRRRRRLSQLPAHAGPPLQVIPPRGGRQVAKPAQPAAPGLPPQLRREDRTLSSGHARIVPALGKVPLKADPGLAHKDHLCLACSRH